MFAWPYYFYFVVRKFLGEYPVFKMGYNFKCNNAFPSGRNIFPTRKKLDADSIKYFALFLQTLKMNRESEYLGKLVYLNFVLLQTSLILPYIPRQHTGSPNVSEERGRSLERWDFFFTHMK